MIIDNVSQLAIFANKSVFLYPILQDGRLHGIANKIIGFVLIDTQTKSTYSLSNGHPDGTFSSADLSFLDSSKVYSYDTLLFKYAGYDTSKFIDVKLQQYLQTNQIYNFETPDILRHYTRWFYDCYKLGLLVPLQKHEEIAYNIFENSFIAEEQPGLEFYQHDLINTFYKIEHNGLKIDSNLFTDRFQKTDSRVGDYSYTQYNYYTTTGRPSNRFGGVNFAALNKEDNTRECFVSRYEDGILVEIDFNSYHPRLIASLIGYDFGEDNVYEHLAKHYNNTQTPTKEEISKAKEATFRQLYGGIQRQYLHIPFFNATNNLAQLLWNEAETKGYIESPISGRKLIKANYQDIDCYVLFNYFIQMYETEHNVMLLKDLFNALEEDILPVLYTYDSILFDLPKSKLKSLQDALDKTIPTNFPYKIKTGTNYNCLR